MVPAPKRAFKALKTKLPLKVSSSSSKRNNDFAPNPGELPLVTLRVQILGASNLLAKDRNGFSDPYAFSSLHLDIF
jgi:phosphatidylserine decarboxylase